LADTAPQLTDADRAALAHVRPLSPKEFADAIGGVRTPRWVRDQCRKGELRTVNGRRPYLITPAELARFRLPEGVAS